MLFPLLGTFLNGLERISDNKVCQKTVTIVPLNLQTIESAELHPLQPPYIIFICACSGLKCASVWSKINSKVALKCSGGQNVHLQLKLSLVQIFWLSFPDIWPYHYSRTHPKRFKTATPSKNTAADESQRGCSSKHTNRFWPSAVISSRRSSEAHV